MLKPLRWLAVGALALAFVSPGSAEEKNGVQLTVSKTTLDRSDQRPGYYYSTRIDRTEALKVSIKNGSFKPMPEGEVRWEILIRRYSSNTVESMSGVEKLKALRPAETAEVVIGGAQVQGWRDTSSQVRDKIEYQVIVMQEGKELIRTNSTSSFDALAKRATKIDPPKK